jgi:drug/metabolite transporter (DMT)-like permease
MDPNQIYTVVAILVALSVASERLVEIIKGVVPFLNNEKKDANREGWRRAALQVLAVVAGIVTALLARPAIQGTVPGSVNTLPGILALGLLASGGSGFWNAILSYLGLVKDIKKVDAAQKKKALTT